MATGLYEPDSKEEQALGQAAGVNAGIDQLNSFANDPENSSKESGFFEQFAEENSSAITRVKGFAKNPKKSVPVLGGTTLFVVGLASLFFSSNVLQLVHWNNVLDNVGFFNSEESSRSSVRTLWRFARNPTSPEIRRQGYFGNKATNAMDAYLRNSTGLNIQYENRTGFFNGIEVDTSTNPAKAARFSEIATDFGLESSITPEGRVRYGVDVGSAQTTRIMDAFVAEGFRGTNADIIPSKILSRPLKLRGAVRSFASPLERYEQKIKQKIADGLDRSTAATEATEEGIRETIGDPPDLPDQARIVAEGDVDPESQARIEEFNTTGGASADAGGSSARLGRLAGTAALLGGACLVQSVGNDMSNNFFTNVLQKIGLLTGDFLSATSSVMAGNVPDIGLLAPYSDRLEGATNNEIYQEEFGNPASGAKLPAVFTYNVGQSIIETISNGLGSIPGFSSACKLQSSPIGSAVTQIAGVAFDFSTGGVSTVAGGLVIDGALQIAIEEGLELLDEEQYDFAELRDGELGAGLLYGSRYLGNTQMQSLGGAVELTSAETAYFRDMRLTQERDAFASLSLKQKIFKYNTPHSLVSRLSTQTASGVDKLLNGSYALGIMNNSMQTMLAKSGLLGSAHAQSKGLDDLYGGLPQIGFTPSELAYQETIDVYALADYYKQNQDVLALHNEEIGRKCLGTTVLFTNGELDLNFESTEKGIKVLSENEACSRKKLSKEGSISNPDALEYRIFVLNAANLQSISCYNGDIPACLDLGL